MAQLVPRDEFDLNEIERRFPNARRNLQGGLFISHSGRDFDRILNDMISPVIYERFGPRYFLHNKESGGAEAYVQLVQAALYYCPYFIVVVSTNSVGHEWVHAEVDWALQHRAILGQCLFDDSDISRVHPALEYVRSVADFRSSKDKGRNDLIELFDAVGVRRYQW
jgi:hypothetical protein